MSQHVPVVSLDLRTGRQRLATEREAAVLGKRDVYIFLAVDAPEVIVRRLSCADPSDQREIWRLAALALLDEEWGAASAIMVEASRSCWSLWAAWRSDDRDFSELWIEAASSVEEATLALCDYVWGPS